MFPTAGFTKFQAGADRIFAPIGRSIGCRGANMLKRFPNLSPPRFILAPASLAILLLGAGSAPAGGYGEEFSLPVLDPIMNWIGFEKADGDSRDLFVAVLIVFAFLFGYFSKLAVKERGFGAVVNGLLGVVGICLALHFALPALSLLQAASDQMRYDLAIVAASVGGGPLPAGRPRFPRRRAVPCRRDRRQELRHAPPQSRPRAARPPAPPPADAGRTRIRSACRRRSAQKGLTGNF
jgi:uncharacterized membrane protein YeaQ/YmgE (transglycosylase-associated protein family)